MTQRGSVTLAQLSYSCSLLSSPTGLSAAPAALILSAQHDNQLKELQQKLQGGGGGLNLHVVAADATKPEEVSHITLVLAFMYTCWQRPSLVWQRPLPACACTCVCEQLDLGFAAVMIADSGNTLLLSLLLLPLTG